MKKIAVISFILLSSWTILAQETDYKRLENLAYYESSIQETDEYLKDRCKLDLYYPTYIYVYWYRQCYTCINYTGNHYETFFNTVKIFTAFLYDYSSFCL